MQTVSVIIPCFNSGDRVKNAVDSAINQSYPPLEIIVIDNGSDVPIAADAFGTNDVIVRVLRIDGNRGPAFARNVGISAARGDVIALLDPDDVWLYDKLKSQISLLDRSMHSAVSCGWLETDEAGKFLKVRVPRDSRQPLDFAAGCWFSPGSTLLITRRSFEIVGLFNYDLCRLSDYEWFLRFALAGGQISVVPEAAVIISAGKRASLDAVKHAKTEIENNLDNARYRKAGRRFRRMAEALLWLELSKAAQNEHRFLWMTLYLLRSIILKPRLRLSLEKWWTIKRKHAGGREFSVYSSPCPRASEYSSFTGRRAQD